MIYARCLNILLFASLLAIAVLVFPGCQETSDSATIDQATVAKLNKISNLSTLAEFDGNYPADWPTVFAIPGHAVIDNNGTVPSNSSNRFEVTGWVKGDPESVAREIIRNNTDDFRLSGTDQKLVMVFPSSYSLNGVNWSVSIAVLKHDYTPPGVSKAEMAELCSFSIALHTF